VSKKISLYKYSKSFLFLEDIPTAAATTMQTEEPSPAVARRYNLVRKQNFSSSEESGAEAPVSVPVELTSTVSGANELIDVSSTDELKLIVDIFSEEENVTVDVFGRGDGGGPWLGV
jgi:hypothetical protein